MPLKSIKKNLLGFAALVIFAGLVVSVVKVSAQSSGGGVGGWAWSSNVGWLSASSSDPGAGGGPYGLSVDSSGNMTGYMWSPNIGWVQFGGLSGFPGSGGNANVNLSTGAVTGWARAVAGTVQPSAWDGWIELSGTNHPTGDQTGSNGVTMNPSTGAFVGYAWGGPVVGWVQFNSGGTTGVTLCPSGSCAPPPPPVLTGACSPSSVTSLTPPPNTVTFNAISVSGGTPPYQYSWAGGVSGTFGSSASYTATYSAPGGSGPILVIKDSAATPQQISASPNCGNVVVNNGSGSGGPISIAVGHTSSDANKTTLGLNRGQSFVLSWANGLPAGYTCSPSVSGPSAGDPSWTAAGNWNSSTDFFANGGIGHTGTMNTNSAPPLAIGSYTFTLSCTKPSSPSYAPTARVTLTVTSEGEI